MALTSLITLNLPAATQSIAFNTPTLVENINYSSSGITYSNEVQFALSQSDVALFLVYQLQFYNALLFNFPVINQSFNKVLPESDIRLRSVTSPDKIIFKQTSTNAPLDVYDVHFNTNTKIATFQARIMTVTVTLQEYLIGFQNLRIWANQCSLV